MIVKILLTIYIFMTFVCLLFLNGYKNRIRKYFEGRDDVIIRCPGEIINFVDISTNSSHLIRCFLPIIRLPIITHNIVNDADFAEMQEQILEEFKRTVNTL